MATDGTTGLWRFAGAPGEHGVPLRQAQQAVAACHLPPSVRPSAPPTP
jgi:hypothetical protein